MREKSLYLYSIFILSIVFNSCYYKPFIGYVTHKKGFKNFNKKERLAGDNSNPHRDYHVNKYDWNLEIFPDKKSISGLMNIYFTTSTSQDIYLFDLQKRMKIESFTCSETGLNLKRKGDLLYLKFDHKVGAHKRIKLSITYKGKPANVVNEGPIQWKTDQKDRPWISTQTEGVGPQFIMPCNALLREEADTCNINITVPKDLTVSANGRLKLIIDNVSEGTKIFKFEVTNPMNIYNISFNVGHFVKLIKPYTDINGVEREIECLVMDYNEIVASKFYDQAPLIMKEFEELYGVFPWWNDGCRFIESTFEAMEHQSGIAMGADYKLDWKDFQLTLIHELSHEWWGNNVTAYDYCDMWMHEGMATYSEALFLEKTYNRDDYYKRIRYFTYSTYNKIPIKKECDVIYNNWGSKYNMDIYDKGALMMHSLRMVVNNDSLFFETLKQVQLDFAKQNVDSDQWVKKFNQLLGNDYTSLFDWYLNKRKPPVLQYYVDKETKEFYYKWKEEIPFYKNGTIEVESGETFKILTPTTTFQPLNDKEFTTLDFIIERSIYYIVEEVKK